MKELQKTYLNLVTLIQLESWSVQGLLDMKVAYNKKFQLARIGDFLRKSRSSVDIEDDVFYKRVRIKIRNGGVEERDVEKGINIGTKKQFLAKPGQFVVSKIDARNGAFGLIPESLDGAIVTNDFPLFDVDRSKILPEFLVLITTTKEFINFAQSCSSGTTNRQRMDIDLFLNQRIPLPSITEQEHIVNAYTEKIEQARQLEKEAGELESGIEEYLFGTLGIVKNEKQINNKGLQYITFDSVIEWGIDKIKAQVKNSTSKFKTEAVSTFTIDVFRGKSPKYKDNTNTIILNQKCNRWNSLDLSFTKTVDEDWYNNIEKSFLTQEGDILINSTGEGTLGRATYIKEDFEGLLYDSHMLLLRVDKNKFNPELFVELFNSSFGQDQVNDIKSAQATKQTELGVNNLLRINMPIPESMQLQKDLIDILKRNRTSALLKNEMAENLYAQAEKEFENEIFG